MRGKLVVGLTFLTVTAALLVFGSLPGRADGEAADPANMIFLPAIIRNRAEGYTISGQVLNGSNVPIAGAVITARSGENVVTAVSDNNGNYVLAELDQASYTLTPSLGGCSFSPPSAEVVVPPRPRGFNFTAAVACSEGIINGGFETNQAWEFPLTEYPAAYSTAEVHGGARSARTGITNPADNRYSYSSVRQVFTIPAGTTGAQLGFWLKPYSGETLAQPLVPRSAAATLGQQPLAGDVQYALILDQNNNWIDTLVWQLSNTRTWTYYEFSLAEYAGRTIKVHIGTYNDGWGGVSAMYVDDVSLQICPGSGSTPAPTLPPGACGNLVDNPSFETISDWEIPVTRYSANYATAKAHTGLQSMRTGIVNPNDNTYSYSDFRQMVSIPAGAQDATLGFWLYTLSGEAAVLSALPDSTPTGQPFGTQALSGDLQYVLILDSYQNWIDTLVWERTDRNAWAYYEFNLLRYAGRTI